MILILGVNLRRSQPTSKPLHATLYLLSPQGSDRTHHNYKLGLLSAEREKSKGGRPVALPPPMFVRSKNNWSRISLNFFIPIAATAIAPLCRR